MHVLKDIEKVNMWEENVAIPTYEVFSAEKSPIFIEKRAYQGSSGKVYPLPVTEKISDTKTNKVYKAVFLENEYLKVMILPELGGRIQRAIDKTNQYDFVYYNHVIKPALVGLAGPWISGGIEFNWPQHHRPSTYLPVDYHLSENEDGSCTVWVGEIDRMYGTKGMAGFTLYPGKAYIEVKGQLYNKTDLPQTFLWWANPAVPVNDNTFSVFPPDVQAVMDHGKRAVSTFPIATGEYYKYDYSEGIDISRYENIEVPTSYMAYHSEFDFIGNYDEGIKAGLLHVADHHISPGKKQWTWGNSDFGQAWDRNLTDEDGPYIELMTGVFADNQPDFTWLKPYEEKTFVQYFMPYKGVGRVKNATCNAVVNCELSKGNIHISVYTTSKYKDALIKLWFDDNIIFETKGTLSPDKCYNQTINTTLEGVDGLSLEITDCEGRLLVRYDAKEKELQPTPSPAEYMKKPEELKSTEELFLAATHLEQYRHATFDAEAYYLEGLKRDSTDIRLNNGYGLFLYRQGHIKKSINHFEAAILKQTWKTPNPYNGECYYNLGLSLVADGRDDEAFDAFYKATWSHETQGAAFFWLACLSCKRENYQMAYDFIKKSLINNWHNMKARSLKAAIMDKMDIENRSWLLESIDIDTLDYGCRFELAIKTNNFDNFKSFMHDSVHNYLELTLDYIKSGLYKRALLAIEQCTIESPMIHYYKAYIYSKMNNVDSANHAIIEAENACPDYCFPNRIEEIIILESALSINDNAAYAHYYLGNLLYDKKRYKDAVNHWEKSIDKNDSFAITFRNLSIAYFNKLNNIEKALELIKKAFQLEPMNSRFLHELNQLMGILGYDNEERLKLLTENLEIVKERDALYIEYITLLNNTGKYEEALQCLEHHIFHPWEGGEGKVSSQYIYALTELALQKLNNGEYDISIELLERTFSYPHNLGEGKLPNVQDNIANYYMGVIYERMDQPKKAQKYYEKASVGLKEPGSVLYYNDQPADTIFYKGLALAALGNVAASNKAYHQLIAYGQKHLFDEVEYDFFAVSLPEINVYQEDIKEKNSRYCKYLMALGKIGLKELTDAEKIFREIVDADSSYQGAIRHLEFIKHMQ